MKEALLKRRYGIPVVLLLVILISIGVVCATFIVSVRRTTTKMEEPISIINPTSFSAEMDPGETNTLKFDIVNDSETISYDICYHVIDGVGDEDEVSVTKFTIDSASYLDNLNGPDNMVTQNDEFIVTLENNHTASVVLQITAETSAPAPQTVDFVIAIGRE